MILLISGTKLFKYSSSKTTNQKKKNWYQHNYFQTLKIWKKFINFSLFQLINPNTWPRAAWGLNIKKTINYKPICNLLIFLKKNHLKYSNINYLRKVKIFNKGRYSRNRQYYRTGVYWCLYINIIALIGLQFWFYRITINFGYLWWLFFIFLGCFILPKFIKFNNKFLLIYQNFYIDIIWFLSLNNKLIKTPVHLFVNLLISSIKFNFFYLFFFKLFY